MKIGVFDSGIGGISVLYQALKLLPRENYIYYADTLHVPYGEKSKNEVRSYVFEAVEFIARQHVKAVVIACNTATSAAVKDLRAKYDFPILGIEPAVKPAITKSHGKSKRVLVLATTLTLKEEKYNNLVSKLDDDHIVDGLPLPGLVEFAERFEFNENIVLPYLAEQLAPYDISQYEVVVLGCTHFPFYKAMLRKLLPKNSYIIDGGIGTAQNLKRTLTKMNRLNEGTGEVIYYNSGIKVEDQRKIRQYTELFTKLEEES